MTKNQKELNDAFLTACFKGNVRDIEKSLDEGANINVLSQDRTNGLFFAIMSENEKAALTVIERGIDITHKAVMNLTPVHMAAVYGQVKAIEAMVAKGADLNASERKDGFTPLMSAVYYIPKKEAAKQKKVVACLINNGADVKKTSVEGKTARDLAENADVIKLLDEAAQKAPVVKARVSVAAIQNMKGRQGR